jgi:coenzyme F420 hydrogenase subunit beta
MFRIAKLKDVVDWGLCTGCGACYYNCDKAAVTLINIPTIGIRPRFESDDCGNCVRCLSICPGYRLDAHMAVGTVDHGDDSETDIGAVLEVWVGHACDTEIRYKGSSGGILSALALYCLEREHMRCVVHSSADDDQPLTNKTVTSFTRHQILARTGSRYSPASPCDGLKHIEESDGPCVFIGKPCDAAAVAMLRREREALDRNLGLVLTFFCAGTPSEQGTRDLLQDLEINPNQVTSIRYRGDGWPGRFRALRDDYSADSSMSYLESWDRLTRYRPLRCNLCPDGLGRIADISCGDAWHNYDESGNPGRSLVLVRTKRGQDILHRAIAAKYIELTPVDSRAVFAAQTSLLQRRRELFGRLLAMRLLMIPTPRFIHFSLLRSWLRLPFRKKVQTIAGTLRRAIARRWWLRRSVF